ncbi:hypothetical protein [Paraburkholderia solisilvae]|nr:hypothetical protein [Paraburkholderia solisilvae]
MKNGDLREMRNATDLESIVRTIGHGLIAFDGCTSVGKTTLMKKLAGRLKCPAIDLDPYLNRQRGEFVNELRLPEVASAIEQAHQQSPIALIAGICMREVLDRLQLTAAVHIYVQLNSPMGIPSNLNIMDREDGHQIDDTYGKLLSETDWEIAAYHERYRPRSNADVIYVRTSGD